MNKIIIIGHGKYGSGLLSALELLSGQDDNVIAIDYKEGQTEVDLREEITKVLNTTDSYLFCCDLMGGTPFKEASRFAIENELVKVVTGANIGALIETKFKKDSLSITDLANSLVEATKKHAMFVEIKKTEEVKENNDGI